MSDQRQLEGKHVYIGSSMPTNVDRLRYRVQVSYDTRER